MAILEKVVVVTTIETTEYTVLKHLGSVAEINAILATIPSSKGSASYSIVDGKPNIPWSGIAGSMLYAYVDGIGFAAGGVATPGLKPMGAKQAGVSYKINELVYENGSTYRSKQNANLNKAVTDTAWWEPFAMKGDQGIQGVEGFSIFTTASDLGTSATTIAASAVNVPSGRTLKAFDIIQTTHATSTGNQFRVLAVSGGNATIQYLGTVRGGQGIQGIQGVQGIESLSIFTTSVDKDSTDTTIPVASVTVPAGRTLKVNDIVQVANTGSTTGNQFRVTLISGGNANISFIGSVRGGIGADGGFFFTTPLTLTTSGSQTISMSGIDPSSRTLKVGDFIVSSSTASEGVVRKVTAISLPNLTTIYVFTGKGVKGDPGIDGDPSISEKKYGQYFEFTNICLNTEFVTTDFANYSKSVRVSVLAKIGLTGKAIRIDGKFSLSSGNLVGAKAIVQGTGQTAMELHKVSNKAVIVLKFPTDSYVEIFDLSVCVMQESPNSGDPVKVYIPLAFTQNTTTMPTSATKVSDFSIVTY